MRIVHALLLILVALAASASPVFAENATRIITLVRHGHYEADPKADPKFGPGLSVLGIAQARLVGGRLGGHTPHFDHVYVSPLTRAQDTAKVIAEDLGYGALETVEGLAECTPPTRRTKVTAAMKAEDLAACAKQLDALFAERFVPSTSGESRELMVCHGNVIRYLITKTLGVDTQAWLEMSVGHTSLTTVRIEADGTLTLIAAGDVGHLPPHLRTGAAGDPDRALTIPMASH